MTGETPEVRSDKRKQREKTREKRERKEKKEKERERKSWFHEILNQKIYIS